MLGRKRSGSCIVETAAGLFVLVPVMLVLIDISALVVAQTSNDMLAKQCARAAAEMPSYQGTSAAQNAYANFLDNALVTKSANPQINYPTSDTVTVTTTITCRLPVPVPFGGPSQQIFQAFSTEPVVGQLPTGATGGTGAAGGSGTGGS
ncbi:MAG TPA: hypothetical protein V6C81_14460 [Planktothrix sp.]|jgi:Flp pilus assembly protein TadG